jgi:alpha-mannosidase
VEVEPAGFVISAVKETEDGRGWLVRGYNITNKALDVKLKVLKHIKSAAIANLAEEVKEKLKVNDGNNITFTAREHEIVSVVLE